jgi:DNA invertase Pin-like site-specific DNA recombinase
VAKHSAPARKIIYNQVVIPTVQKTPARLSERVVQLLSTSLAAIAEFERELIRERTGEGRKRAMANGVKFGRRRRLSDCQRGEAIKRRASGETLDRAVQMA